MRESSGSPKGPLLVEEEEEEETNQLWQCGTTTPHTKKDEDHEFEAVILG